MTPRKILLRTAALAACLAAGASASGLAALTAGRSTVQFPATPARAHAVLGPVQTLAAPGPDAPAVPLAEAARTRYGRVDALAQVRAAPLPFADAALVTGVAIRWK